MPSLISRLDRLDSMMKCLEGRVCSSARWASDDGVVVGIVKRECVPLDLAVNEAQSKGSILDRIATLEDRLVQLCLDVKCEVAFPSKNWQVEQSEASPHISRRGLSNSFSRFRLPHCIDFHKQSVQVSTNDFSVIESKKYNPGLEPCTQASQGKKFEKTKDEKASPKQKKSVHSSLLHLKILGC